MPKAVLQNLKPIHQKLQAGKFANLGVDLGKVVQDCGKFAVARDLPKEVNVLASQIYRLGLQMRLSQEPTALLAYMGHELQIDFGWITASAFGAEPIPRDNYHIPAARDRNGKVIDGSMEMYCMDWKLQVGVPKEGFLSMLKTLGQVLASDKFKGTRFHVYENIEEDNRIVIETNSELIAELYEELDVDIIKGLKPELKATKMYCDKNGNEIVDLIGQRESDPAKRAKILESLGFDPTSRFGCLKGDSGILLDRVITLVQRQRAHETKKDFAIITDLGVEREHNEDAAGYIKLDDDREVFIVADGMGGHMGGDISSKLAVETVQAELSIGRSITEAIISANTAVAKAGIEMKRFGRERGIGTTIVVAMVDRKAKRLSIGWVGDSRAKFVSKDAAGILTRDHSYILEFIADRLKKKGMKDPVLPFTSKELEVIEENIVEVEDSLFPDFRQQGNVISSGLGSINVFAADVVKAKNENREPQINIPKIGLMEVPFVEGENKTKLVIYSDGAVDGYENDVEAEAMISAMIMKASSPRELAGLIVSNALSGKIGKRASADNTTVIAAMVPELMIDDLVEISSPEFQKELFEKLSDERSGILSGDLRLLAKVFMLNKGLVPEELIERIRDYIVKRMDEGSVIPDNVLGYLDVIGISFDENKTMDLDPEEIEEIQDQSPEEEAVDDAKDTIEFVTETFRRDAQAPSAPPSIDPLHIKISHARPRSKKKLNATYVYMLDQKLDTTLAGRLTIALSGEKVKDKLTVHFSRSLIFANWSDHYFLVKAIVDAVKARKWVFSRGQLFVYYDSSVKKNYGITVYTRKEVEKFDHQTIKEYFPLVAQEMGI